MIQGTEEGPRNQSDVMALLGPWLTRFHGKERQSNVIPCKARQTLVALDPARRAESESGHRIRLASLNALERRFLKEIFTLLKGVRDGLVARFAL